MDGKRSGDGRYSIDGSRGGGAISSDKDALFVLWFHSINLQHPGVGVYGDDQGKANAEKADRSDGADRAAGAEADGDDGVDGADGYNVMKSYDQSRDGSNQIETISDHY